MSKELYEGQPKLGIPKAAGIPLIVLTSVSVCALVAVLIILGRNK